VGDRWVPADLLDRLAGAVRIQLEAHHRDDPSSPGLSLETVRRRLGRRAWLGDEVLRRLGDDGVLLVAEGIVARRDFVPRARGGEAEVLRLVTALEAAGLEPPTVDELAAGLELTDFDGALRIAAGRGEIQAVERDRFYARAALERFLTAVREEGRSGAIVPAALRERLGLSRKYLIPLLEWSDRQGVTRRTPDGGRTLA
jgi:selenocysteine-specific elongation factor